MYREVEGWEGVGDDAPGSGSAMALYELCKLPENRPRAARRLMPVDRSAPAVELFGLLQVPQGR
ncbi:hypothetical protein ACP70R_017167 [Stipagrostis hirtigluma subsp. patula]